MNDDWQIITAADVVEAPDVALLVQEAAAGTGDVLIDLSRTTLLTASGVRGVLELHELVEARGRTTAARGASPLVTKVFDITGLHRAVPILETVKV